MKRVAIASFLFLIAGLLMCWAFPTRILWEKLATALAMPVGLAWLLLTIALVVSVCQRQKWTWIFVGLSWLLLTLGGNTYVARLAMVSLEREFLDADRTFDVPLASIVVLGGGATSNGSGVAQMETAGDRLSLAAELYHAGKAERIICTGSNIDGMDLNGVPTGELSAEVLRRLGVPSDRLRTVGGRTTQEEMNAVSDMLQGESNVGLITSASHMRRALRLASKQGLEFTPLPADFAARPIIVLRPIDVVPTGIALDMSARATKEYLARLVGR